MDARLVRPLLEERLRSLDEGLAKLTAIPRDPMTAVSFGKRIGDGTTEAVERLSSVGTAQSLDAMRADVVRALAKLDDGTYGICDRCGRLISPDRLDARPWSVRCIDCAASG